MLPFLKPEKMTSVIVAKRKDGEMEPINEEGSPSPELVMAMQDFMQAISNKDAGAAAMALEYAIECVNGSSMGDEASE